ncbi:MAG: helix-turn-helix domain-containing protein [Scytonema sp. PMC 1069.18]|nr:helix-turn-helix domain-containing protein [Scytonema sp. PMC 1069.18]MEC4885653.1 helix-turn-helix domain-containing protein [Scytonema sp. PMC 1070.18]
MNPRPLSQQEQDLIKFYSRCQLGMTPEQFYSKWQVNYDMLAQICSRSLSTVQGWFAKGRYYRRPTPTDLRHLALMDFLLEHFQDIPPELLIQLCFLDRRNDFEPES